MYKLTVTKVEPNPNYEKSSKNYGFSPIESNPNIYSVLDVELDSEEWHAVKKAVIEFWKTK